MPFKDEKLQPESPPKDAENILAAWEEQGRPTMLDLLDIGIEIVDLRKWLYSAERLAYGGPERERRMEQDIRVFLGLVDERIV